MAQQILTEIGGKLSSLGIPVQFGNGSDITIHTEFLDAGWSTGSKKIAYEAAVFANSQDNTVYMYEKTTETGHGFSFGGSSESSFQSGKTLFRKVKSIQYGPDGKSYEYTLDLGAIPKAVKETAKLHGWRFKTVIDKAKAMYPAGYVQMSVKPTDQAQTYGQTVASHGGFCSNCGMPIAGNANFCDKCGKPIDNATVSARTQYSNPQGSFYAAAPKKSGKKGGVFGLVGFILLGIILLVMLLAAKATPTGWAVCLGLFAIAFILQRLLRKKGCFLHLILWIITGFLLLISLTMFTEGDFSFTTAGIKNAHMTTAMDANGKPIDKVSSYLPNAPELVAVAELRNAPAHTQVKFVWKYVTQDMLITEYLMDSGENDANVYVFSNLTNDKPWPEGEYMVEIYVADRLTPDATVTFTVSSTPIAVAPAENGENQQKDSPYYLAGFSYSAGAGAEDENIQERQYDPFVLINFIIDISTDYHNDGQKPASIYLTNFKVVKPPKIGNVAFLKVIPDNVQGTLKDEINKRSISDKYELDISSVKDMDGFSQSILLDVVIYDTAIVQYGKNVTSIASDRVITDAGINYMDVQTEISFDVVAETVDGEKYVKPLQFVAMPDDFINNPDAVLVSESYYGLDQMKPFIKA